MEHTGRCSSSFFVQQSFWFDAATCETMSAETVWVAVLLRIRWDCGFSQDMSHLYNEARVSPLLLLAYAGTFGMRDALRSGATNCGEGQSWWWYGEWSQPCMPLLDNTSKFLDGVLNRPNPSWSLDLYSEGCARKPDHGNPWNFSDHFGSTCSFVSVLDLCSFKLQICCLRLYKILSQSAQLSFRPNNLLWRSFGYSPKH